MNAAEQPLLPLCRRLRDARRAKGMTQSELAGQVGCQQSAISMLEAGRMEALARPTVEKMAALLGVDLDTEPARDALPSATGSGRGFCPNGDCPSNVPFAIGGELIFWPRRQPVEGGRHCAFCGEVLERVCRQCGAPATEGACCATCGTPRVPPPPLGDSDLDHWAETRRRCIADWRALHAQ
ncbi:MAG: helix-turn-helix transcriptional regulator [Kiritimatiellae bacterium]|nr:helix-turn-helix transcriptional regulator [Kiritimatiellia bacterium]